VDPCELLIPLVSFETENKSVFGLLLLRTGLISLQFPFFSLSLSPVITPFRLLGDLVLELQGLAFDDEDSI
jgi:hypothetical protein